MGVLLIGSLNIDLVSRVETMVKPGETIMGKDFQTFPGGKGLNQAVAAARAGGEVTMVGVLGTDSNSQVIRRLMKDEKIDQSFVSEVDGVCGTAIIEVDSSGQNRIIVIAGANSKLKAKNVDEKALSSVKEKKILLAQLESPIEELEILFKRAKEEEFFTILNPAPAAALSNSFVSYVDLLIPNQFEAETLTGIRISDEASAIEAGKKLMATGVGSVLITLGGDGSLLITKDGSQHFPAFSVSPIDTTAAGDAFCGALATSLSKGVSLQDAIPFASAAGALATTKTGATPSLPTASEISSMLINMNNKEG